MTKKLQKKIRVGVSGDKGSFSEEAAVVYCRNEGVHVDIKYLTDMDGVLSALNKDMIELGIFPVVNSIGGLVHPAFVAMGKYNFTLIDQLPLDIRQNLMVRKGIKKSDITEIVSHSQALAQCERYLRSTFPEIPLTAWQDTAKAAHDLKNGILAKTAAVIAPIRSAEVYGLEVLERSIQDMHPNITTFIIVKK